MADYFTPTVIDPVIPLAAMLPIERMFLAQVFDEVLDGESAYYFSDDGANDLISLPANEVRAALDLLGHLAAGRRVDASTIRTAMQSAFGASDASGAWDWKTAYEAVEVAQVLFMRRYGPAIHARSADPFERLKLVERIAALAPTQTRRSEEMQAYQQFSTPLGLAWIAGFAASFVPVELVLEPSAGTGLLAIQAELGASRLALNEVADVRAALLRQLFGDSRVTTHDAAQIHDRLDPSIVPTCIVMNPPFSAALGIEARVADTAFRHLSSAVARLADGGRLVVITGANCSPEHSAWRSGFVRLQENARVVFTAPIAGAIYAAHGTTFETRLTVIDKLPADDPTCFPAAPGTAPDLPTLLRWLNAALPPRSPVAVASMPVSSAQNAKRSAPAARAKRSVVSSPELCGVELAYETADWSDDATARLSDTLYVPYALQSLGIPNAQPHPTMLVQSAAMASVAPSKPSYRPHLPAGLVEQGLLSDAQLESVIYAGEAHSKHLDGSWTIDATYDKVEAAPDDSETSVRFRKGWFLGDGTGAGKGRQVAGIILDNWLKGRRRAVWISKSDKLLEDAQRDWRALGQEPLLVTPLARFRQGTPIRLEQGILFTTYATLRSTERDGRVSRVQQIVDWLGHDFDGVIVFDESHAMQNAGGGKSERGDSAPSQQGRAGLRLQHALPDARVLYVSATGATTGRSRRIVRKVDEGGERFVVENRPAQANLAEAQAFMEDRKRILVFSDAGGTGRSYHADLGSRNQRLRHHYLLEAGWKADAAIQGLGRTNRTNQAQPPLFRPVATDVQAEKRFLSTIARRLDTLGAITRGQRQTGGQGLFRPEDNLESPYARDALRQLYLLIYAGKVEGCSLATFEGITGLSLTDGSGCLKDELPPITTFLNRLLALTIAMQNVLFTVFEQLLAAKVESAMTSGTYDLGLETLTADSFTVAQSETIYTHPATGAETRGHFPTIASLLAPSPTCSTH